MQRKYNINIIIIKYTNNMIITLKTEKVVEI